MIYSAAISPCGRYRYSLGRVWDEAKPQACWVMLNPSTADAVQNDPTIRKCIGFSERLGFGGLAVVNLFAFRATRPTDLIGEYELLDGAGVTGPQNDVAIANAILGRKIILAWGNVPNALKWRADGVLRFFSDRPVYCLGTNKSGQPRHPLFLRSDTELIRLKDPRRSNTKPRSRRQKPMYGKAVRA
jgi:hypothetical protein